jgi:hypothetical protein
MRQRLVAFVSVAAALVVAAPASALPGQTIAAFKSWTQSKSLVRNVEKKTAEMSGLPYFNVTNADHGIAWEFTANTDGKIVTDESLGVSEAGGDVGSAPIHHDGTGYGFTFFKSLYGAATAADFKSSKLVAKIIDKTDAKNVTYFWRGKTYGYSTATNGKYLSVYSLSSFAKTLALAQRCNAHPNDCSE